MALVRTHKRKKSSRFHGRKMGTAGTGARKNKRKSGHKGGVGMSGSGKRADHKKTLVTKLYGNAYFGKSGVTSRGTKRDTRQRINVGDLSQNILSYVARGKATKKGSQYEVSLKNYKLLGSGEVMVALIVTAQEASPTALKKIEAAGGKVILPEAKKESAPSPEEATA